MQVFVFDVGGDSWRSYNWSMVTTVAAFGKYDPELMCYAHSRGARVVLKGGVNCLNCPLPFKVIINHLYYHRMLDQLVPILL